MDTINSEKNRKKGKTICGPTFGQLKGAGRKARSKEGWAGGFRVGANFQYRGDIGGKRGKQNNNWKLENASSQRGDSKKKAG